QVSNILPMMNEQSKTFLVEATFIDPPKILYPFISFEANIVIQTKEKALLIPRNLLVNDSTVIKANGDKVIVKTGLKDYQMVEILSGITADDELISPAK
ncbi:MAG: RND transporter, partial [Bacteroidia bacterium]